MSLQQMDNSAIKDSCLSVKTFLFTLQLNFLWQSAASVCADFLTFLELTPSPSSGCAGGLVAAKLWCYQTTCTP
jgi:hypothetical protein